MNFRDQDSIISSTDFGSNAWRNVRSPNHDEGMDSVNMADPDVSLTPRASVVDSVTQQVGGLGFNSNSYYVPPTDHRPVRNYQDPTFFQGHIDTSFASQERQPPPHLGYPMYQQPPVQHPTAAQQHPAFFPGYHAPNPPAQPFYPQQPPQPPVNLAPQHQPMAYQQPAHQPPIHHPQPAYQHPGSFLHPHAGGSCQGFHSVPRPGTAHLRGNMRMTPVQNFVPRSASQAFQPDQLVFSITTSKYQSSLLLCYLQNLVFARIVLLTVTRFN